MKDLLAIFLFLPPAGFGQARTITVDDDCPADFNNIQAAIDFANATDVAEHDKMVRFIDGLLDWHKELTAARVPDEKTKIQHQIKITNGETDQFTCQLYNLIPQEMKIIEESTK